MTNIWKKTVVTLAMAVGMVAGAAMGSQQAETASDSQETGGQETGAALALCCSQCLPSYNSCVRSCNAQPDCNRFCQVECKNQCVDSYEQCGLYCSQGC